MSLGIAPSDPPPFTSSWRARTCGRWRWISRPRCRHERPRHRLPLSRHAVDRTQVPLLLRQHPAGLRRVRPQTNALDWAALNQDAAGLAPARDPAITADQRCASNGPDLALPRLAHVPSGSLPPPPPPSPALRSAPPTPHP